MGSAVPVLRALYQGISYYKTHQAQAISAIEANADETASVAKVAYDTTKSLYANTIVPTVGDQDTVLMALAPTQPAANNYAAGRAPGYVVRRSGREEVATQVRPGRGDPLRGAAQAGGASQPATPRKR